MIKVLVIEGPAGSGKSYLLRSLLDRSDGDNFTFVEVGLPHEFARPRAYTGGDLDDFGTAMAYAKDLSRIAQLSALITASEGVPLNNVIYVIDRFLLSSFVYGSLRYHARTPHANAPRSLEYRRAMITMLNTLWSIPKLVSQYNGRYPGVHSYAPVPSVDFSWFFLMNMPNYQTIEERRARCTREFPYSALDEWMEYSEIYTSLGGILRGEYGDIFGLKLKVDAVMEKNQHEPFELIRSWVYGQR